MAKIIEASALISARVGDMSGIDKLAAKLLSASKMGDEVKMALSGAGTDLANGVEEISGNGTVQLLTAI
jgi:hypothetical protein